jgi:hypothetical protein
MTQPSVNRQLVWVAVFGVAFAFVESSVVVYLRALYYPEGFSFPLKLMEKNILLVELSREAATIIMLAAAGSLAGRTRWEKFAYFMIAFGVWDIFYYVWLFVVLGWPGSLFDWDILFLIPLPWIGPVVAAILVSLLMIIAGVIIVRRNGAGQAFRVGIPSWILAIGATGFILYSFMKDTAATLNGAIPAPYDYLLFSIGMILYIAALALAVKSSSNIHAGARG